MRSGVEAGDARVGAPTESVMRAEFNRRTETVGRAEIIRRQKLNTKTQKHPPSVHFSDS